MISNLIMIVWLLWGANLLSCSEQKDERHPRQASNSADGAQTAGVQGDEIEVPAKNFTRYSSGNVGDSSPQIPAGLKTASYTSSDGEVGEYTLFAPSDNQARGLLVYLHGSGNAAAYANAMNGIKPVADQFDLIPLLVKTSRTDSWLEGGVANLLYLDEIIEKEVMASLNIDKQKVFFAGVSGGAVFLTGYFVPRYGYKYRGGAICLCGGEMSILNGIGGIYLNEDLQNYLPIVFYTQQEDYMYDQVKGGEAYYRSKGLKVTAQYPEGGSHCGFNTNQILGEKIQELIAKMPK